MIDNYLHELNELGYCLLKGVFGRNEVSLINEKLDSYILAGHEGIVTEDMSSAVRGVHGPHLYDDFFNDLAKNKTLLNFSNKYLDDDVYIHQYKINMKRALEGKSWPWHQDFVYWREYDKIQTPKLLNIAIALDDISMLQGPLCFIPKSHKLGELTNYRTMKVQNWEKTVSSNITYQLEKDTVAKLVEEYGFDFVLAKAGDVIFFDAQLAHCSSNNLSGSDRRLMLITFNAVGNAPAEPSIRPVFLAGRNYAPIM